MTKRQKATRAQAKYLARLWSEDRREPVGLDYTNSTTKACIRYGWLVPDGGETTFPNGATAYYHVVSDDGLDALKWFLMDMKYAAAAKARIAALESEDAK